MIETKIKPEWFRIGWIVYSGEGRDKKPVFVVKRIHGKIAIVRMYDKDGKITNIEKAMQVA